MFWVNNAGVDYSHNMPQHKMVICLLKPHHGLSKENTLVIIKPYAMELMQHINHYIERKEKHKKQER